MGVSSKKRGGKYLISYRDEAGRWRTVTGFSDKRASQAQFEQLQTQADRKRLGLPVDDEAILTVTVAKAIEDYVADMQRQGLSEAHWKESRRHLKTLQLKCSWRVLADIRADSLTGYLQKLQQLGRAARTINGYRDHLLTFCTFCVGRGWMASNPIEKVSKARSHERKQPRRAYTVDEFRRLLAATRSHRLLYLVAGLSGLRKRELRLLEKRDLTPVGDSPTWHLRPAISKGRRRDVVPILPELLPELRAHWDSLPEPTSRLFPRVPRTATHHKDMRRAKVPRQDAEGRWAVFHSFRYFFCTLLARKLPIQTVRLLMRHRDIHETVSIYMDLGLDDVREDMLRLPPLVELDRPAA